jgi:hypothetical protein
VNAGRANDVSTAQERRLYVIGDADVDGPDTGAAWETAIHTLHRALGLSARPPFAMDVFLDVREFVTPT